tara:strand:+ start:880 stop:1626 length:747 start_codon:yes stop_codon:yes gene_type:complete
MSFKIFKGIYKSSKEIKIKTDNIYNTKDYLIRNTKKVINQIKESGQTSHNYDLNAVVVTNLILKKKVKVIDFGGGLGNSYIDLIKKIDPKNLTYTIFDYKEILDQSKKLLNNKKNIPSKNLKFVSNLKSLNKCDILHFGNCLEHFEDFESMFFELLKITKPKIIVISAFYVGSSKNFTTIGKYYGKKFILHFKSWEYFYKIIKKFKYKIVYKTTFLPRIRKRWTFYNMDNFPKLLRINYTWNIILERI